MPTNNRPWLGPTDPYQIAWYEHAWLLRCEGLIYAEIGKRLGVTGSRAQQMVACYTRIIQWATRKAEFYKS